MFFIQCADALSRTVKLLAMWMLDNQFIKGCIENGLGFFLFTVYFTLPWNHLKIHHQLQLLLLVSNSVAGNIFTACPNLLSIEMIEICTFLCYLFI